MKIPAAAHIKKQKGSDEIKFRLASSYNSEVSKMELSNEFVEDLFLQQIKELTTRTNKQLKSFDAQFSGVKVK